MYKGFSNAVKWLGDLASANTLVIIAISMLCVVLVYEIVMTVIVIRMKRNKKCLCNIIQINDYRRWAAMLLAWLFAGFALLNIVPFETPIAVLPASELALPLVFLFIFHLIEFLFMVINRCNCRCNCGMGCDCKSAEKHSEKSSAIVEEPKQEIQSAPDTYPTPEVVTIDESPKEDKKVTRNPTQKRAASATRPRASTTTSTGAARGRPKSAAASNSSKKPTAMEKEIDRKNERIEELGEKIERQRKQAEKLADTIVPQDFSYSADTREAMHNAEEAAIKMDELQRRMDALRKTVNTRDVTTTERVIRQEDYRQNARRSITELRREQENMKRQYDILQNKLEQMHYENIMPSSYDDRRAEVGYYSTANNFERTGKTENLSKIPSRNKFDEEEVKVALLGLKHAMEDLQRQIDANAD